MRNTPPIKITAVDLDRLERLIQNLDSSSVDAQALEIELGRAEVVSPEHIPSNVVTMNSQVLCRENVSGQEYRLTLVYPEDAGTADTVSVLAPVGSALLGLSVGQEIDWPIQRGKLVRLTLLDVTYQPEASKK
ncbi:nucleoside diphosphate kinase regulator [Pseudomonas koreensis]|uniref:nucleoside diphosphate kinase regulator n=1 Tax=Pseudomonas koreensis TaxID=198620 RepID=UPI0037FEB546